MSLLLTLLLCICDSYHSCALQTPYRLLIMSVLVMHVVYVPPVYLVYDLYDHNSSVYITSVYRNNRSLLYTTIARQQTSRIVRRSMMLSRSRLQWFSGWDDLYIWLRVFCYYIMVIMPNLHYYFQRLCSQKKIKQKVKKEVDQEYSAVLFKIRTTRA